MTNLFCWPILLVYIILVVCVVINQQHVSAAPPDVPSTNPVSPSTEADITLQASGGTDEEPKPTWAGSRPDPPSDNQGQATDSVSNRHQELQERRQALLRFYSNFPAGSAAASVALGWHELGHAQTIGQAMGTVQDTEVPVPPSSYENGAQTVHEPGGIGEYEEEHSELESPDQHEELGAMVGNMDGASSSTVNETSPFADQVSNVEEPVPPMSFGTATEETEGPEAGLLDIATGGCDLEGPDLSTGFDTAEAEDLEAGLLDTAMGGADPEMYWGLTGTELPWPPDLDDIDDGYQIDRDLHGSDHRLQYNPDLMIGTRSGISACPAPNYEQYVGDHYNDLAAERRRRTREAARRNRTQRPWNIQPVDESGPKAFAGVRDFHDADVWRNTPRQWNEQPQTGRENETETDESVSPDQACVETELQTCSYNMSIAALGFMSLGWQQGRLATSHGNMNFPLLIMAALCLLHLFIAFFLILASFLVSFFYYLGFLLGL